MGVSPKHSGSNVPLTSDQVARSRDSSRRMKVGRWRVSAPRRLTRN